MFRGYAVTSMFYSHNDVFHEHPMTSMHHALCQELSTARIIKTKLEKEWGEKLMIQDVEWELCDRFKSRDGRERI